MRMDLGLKCTNCENAEAELICLQCKGANEENAFCNDCSVIHNSQWESRDHAFAPMHGPVCWNCQPEKRISTHRCMDCVDRAQYLCLSCSSIHCRVKRFKDHRIVEIDGNEKENQCSSSRLDHMLPSSSSSSSSSRVAVEANDYRPSHLTSSGTHEGILDFSACPHLPIHNQPSIFNTKIILSFVRAR